MSKIFVYGTLKEGFGNHTWYLKNKATKLGEHTTEAKHTMVSLGGFPGVLYGKGITAIKGEVYEVDEATSKAIDGLEGYPTFYDKVIINTPYGDATMYVLSKAYLSRGFMQMPIIETGDWAQ